MSLNIKALATTGAVLGAGCVLLTGLANLVFPSYGVGLLELAASVYPGYDGPNGIGSVVVGTLYAALDGGIAFAVIAWVYNLAAGQNKAGGT